MLWLGYWIPYACHGCHFVHRKWNQSVHKKLSLQYLSISLIKNFEIKGVWFFMLSNCYQKAVHILFLFDSGPLKVVLTNFINNLFDDTILIFAGCQFLNLFDCFRKLRTWSTCVLCWFLVLTLWHLNKVISIMIILSTTS